MRNLSKKTFLTLTISIISLEIFAAFLSYENFGWEMPYIVSFLIFLNIVPIIFYLFKKRFIASLLLISLGIIIIPEQAYYSVQHLQLKNEATNITNYLYQYKSNNGEYPKNLKDYKFKFTDLKNHTQYSKYRNDEFMITYYIAWKSTSHFYNSRNKQWNYYDD